MVPLMRPIRVIGCFFAKKFLFHFLWCEVNSHFAQLQASCIELQHNRLGMYVVSTRWVESTTAAASRANSSRFAMQLVVRPE